MNLKFNCLDGCKWRCDFDSGNDVFCHAIGEDLTADQINLLIRVGCSTRQPPEKR